jgi:hypothetical protein
VRFLFSLAHETAGAARIRLSLRPLGVFSRAANSQSPGASRRGNAKTRPLAVWKLNRKPDEPEIKPATDSSLPATNAERLRKGALATKQSILSFRFTMDCFASLAMTADSFLGFSRGRWSCQCYHRQ